MRKMNNKKKIEAVIDRIKEEGLIDEHVGVDEVYMSMKGCRLEEIAEGISNLINLVYDVREILEEE